MKLKRSSLHSPFLRHRLNRIVTSGEPHYRFTNITVEQYNDIIPGLKLYFAYKEGLHFKIVADHYVDCKTFENLMWGIIALQWPANYTFSGKSASDPTKCTTMEVHWGTDAARSTGYSYSLFHSWEYNRVTDLYERELQDLLNTLFPKEYDTMKALRQLVKGGPVIGVYDDGYRGYNKAEVRFEFCERIDETTLPGYESDGIVPETKSGSSINPKTIIIISAVALSVYLILKR